MTVDFDNVLLEIGDFGRYQKFVVYMLCIPACFLNVFNNLGLVFQAYSPAFRCQPSENAVFNKSVKYDEVCGYSYFDLSDNGSEYNSTFTINNGTCPSFDYDKEHFESTIITQFDLVCDRSINYKVILSLFNGLSIVGCFLYSYVQDKWGRKKAFTISLTAFLFGSIASLYAPNLWTFTVLRVPSVMGASATWSISYIWGLEYVGPSKRPYVTFVMSILYGVAAIALGLIAWLCRTWVQLGLATSCPFILLYLFQFFIDESPRWLLIMGRTKEAEKTIRKMAAWQNITLKSNTLTELLGQSENLSSNDIQIRRKISNDIQIRRKTSNDIQIRDATSKDIQIRGATSNDIQIPCATANILEIPGPYLNDEQIASTNLNGTSSQSESSNNIQIRERNTIDIQIHGKLVSEEGNTSLSSAPAIGFINLFRNSNILRKTLVITAIWFSIGVTDNTLDYNVENLGGNFYVAYVFQAAVQVPASFAAWLLLAKFGRILPLSFSLIIFCGLFSILSLPANLISDWIVKACAAAAKFGAYLALTIIYQLGVEIYPTILRGCGIGFSSAMADLGTICMPFIIHTSETSSEKLMPMIVIGVISLMSGVACLFLPETSGKSLPESVDEAVNQGEVGILTAKTNIKRFFNVKVRSKYEEQEL